ncbi:hypothetical protein ACFPM0_00010 [Pseudonocardia sulfidoxydans]|uniref:hypothetical protein n=1 Tax=Pseudonocardia sulfidoxydans TaxID=54011 RepID=UPI00362228CC
MARRRRPHRPRTAHAAPVPDLVGPPRRDPAAARLVLSRFRPQATCRHTRRPRPLRRHPRPRHRPEPRRPDPGSGTG